MFKSLPDPLWHASVLEGLATVPILEAWTSGAGLVMNFSRRFSVSYLKAFVERFRKLYQGSLDRSCRENCPSLRHILEDHTRSRPGSTVSTLDVSIHHLRLSAHLSIVFRMVCQGLGARCIYDTVEPRADTICPTNSRSSRSTVFCQPGTAFCYFRH